MTIKNMKIKRMTIKKMTIIEDEKLVRIQIAAVFVGATRNRF